MLFILDSSLISEIEQNKKIQSVLDLVAQCFQYYNHFLIADLNILKELSQFQLLSDVARGIYRYILTKESQNFQNYLNYLKVTTLIVAEPANILEFQNNQRFDLNDDSYTICLIF